MLKISKLSDDSFLTTAVKIMKLNKNLNISRSQDPMEVKVI